MTTTQHSTERKNRKKGHIMSTATTAKTKNAPTPKGKAVMAGKKKKTAADRAADRAGKAQARAKEAQTSSTLPLGDRIRIRWGAGGAKALYGFIRGVLLGATVLLSWILALFAASNVAPNLMLVISETSGLKADAAFDQVLVSWVAPSLVLILLLTALVIAVVAWLWKTQIKLGAKARRALLGEDS